MNTITLKLTIKDAADIESALRLAAFNAESAANHAQRLGLDVSVQNRLSEKARAEAAKAVFSAAFDVAVTVIA